MKKSEKNSKPSWLRTFQRLSKFKMRRTISTHVYLTLFAFALSFGLCGATCQRVVINDHEVCGDKGSLGASCFFLLSDGKRKLTLPLWDEERFGQLCMRADAYANLKEALLKLCDQTQRCTWEEVEAIQTVGNRLEAFTTEARLDNGSP